MGSCRWRVCASPTTTSPSSVARFHPRNHQTNTAVRRQYVLTRHHHRNPLSTAGLPIDTRFRTGSIRARCASPDRDTPDPPVSPCLCLRPLFQCRPACRPLAARLSASSRSSPPGRRRPPPRRASNAWAPWARMSCCSGRPSSMATASATDTMVRASSFPCRSPSLPFAHLPPLPTVADRVPLLLQSPLPLLCVPNGSLPAAPANARALSPSFQTAAGS